MKTENQIEENIELWTDYPENNLDVDKIEKRV
jgi:hypothetical protein